MTVVSIDAGRDAFRTRERPDDGPGESFDRDPGIDMDKDIVPGRDDHARFASLVLPHLGDAYSLARWITGSRADAEDVVQDSCLRAFRAIGGLADGSARPWVLTIVRNTAYTWLRKNRRRSLARRPQFMPLLDNAPDASGTEAEGRDIARALATLVEEQRAVLLLVTLEGLSYREVADIQGVPIGTVMSRLARARAHVKASLEGERPALRRVK